MLPSHPDLHSPLKNPEFQKLVTYPYKTNRVKLPGNVEIAYIDEGRAEKTLVFIHGLANYALCWRKNIDYLRQFYRCIAIDLPGNGLSDRNDHAFGIPFFAGCVYDFISALGLKNVCIVGHSMGGQVAITTVLDHPSCAHSLVLCAPAGFEQFTGLERTLYHNTLQFLDFLSTDEHSLRKTIERSFYHLPPQAEEMIHELVGIMKTDKTHFYRKMLDACVKSLLADAVYDRLPLIKMPTLVLFGAHDALIPNKLLHPISTEKLAVDTVKTMQNAILKMIPDAGHFVQWEKADDVNRMVIMFLEGGKG